MRLWGALRASSDGAAPRARAPQDAAPAQMHAIQRFGSSVNLHIHDQAVVSDGAFAVDRGVLRFYLVAAPSPEELSELTERLRRRILRRMKPLGAPTSIGPHERVFGVGKGAEGGAPAADAGGCLTGPDNSGVGGTPPPTCAWRGRAAPS